MKKSKKCFGAVKKVLTFASAFAQKRATSTKERVLWKIYIDSEVVQEARQELCLQSIAVGNESQPS